MGMISSLAESLVPTAGALAGTALVAGSVVAPEATDNVISAVNQALVPKSVRDALGSKPLSPSLGGSQVPQRQP